MKIKNKRKRKCSCQDKAMLYALVQITADARVLLSADEISVFEDYLKAAKEDDKDICVDLDTCDNEPYQLVYGAVMFHGEEKEKVLEYINGIKNYALINVDGREFGKLTASAYADICLFEDRGKYSESIPFVALMQTLCTEEQDTSTTMFLYCNRSVWENMVNRTFLLACRRFIKIEGLTPENWRSYIDMKTLDEAYYYADLYTGKTED